MSLRIISSHGIRHDLVTIRSWRASLFLIFYFFLSRESRFCFRERHGCAFARVTAVPPRKRKKRVFSFFFPSARVTIFLRREARLWFHERYGRASFGKGKTRTPGSVFPWKKVRQNLSTWDLVLKISTRRIQLWKWFKIWTYGLRDKTF